MPGGRTLSLVLLFALLVPGAAWAEPSAGDTVTAIYRRASAGKGDSGGQFLWLESGPRHAAFTRALSALWDRADAATAAGDEKPPGFDPVTDSQDPNLKAFRVTTEEETPERARIAVGLMDRAGSARPYSTVHYLLLREDGRWLIDDITGSGGGTAWSLRELLEAQLVSYGPPPGVAAPKR
jgi:hypothetical protein